MARRGFLKPRTIRSRRMNLALRRRKAERAYLLQQQALDSEESMLQKRCRHDNVTYYGDPAGGSDSCYRCSDCGAESKHGWKGGR